MHLLAVPTTEDALKSYCSEICCRALGSEK